MEPETIKFDNNNLPSRDTKLRGGNLILVSLIILCSLITGLAVNFFNHVHYNNLLLKAASQTTADQTEIGKQQYDIRLLVNSSNNQFNCYSLRSGYARSICSEHANIPSTTAQP